MHPHRSSSPFSRLPASLPASLLSATLLAAALPVTAQTSFDCRKAQPGTVAGTVCRDPALAELDRALGKTYGAALKAAAGERPPLLKAEQRGWIKGLEECRKEADARTCAERSYRRRNAELQARYRLVAGDGPVSYVCDGNPADEVRVTYHQTEPATLIAERGGAVSLMFQQSAASGAKYEGRNEMLWEHKGDATIRWGYDAKEMQCLRKASR